MVFIGESETEVLKFAAALESGSNHPLAKAILGMAADRKINVPSVVDAKAIGGKGVTATVDGLSLFLGSPKAAGEHATKSDPRTRTRSGP